MVLMLSGSERAKFMAAKLATDYVESGMKVGLGTGSTAAWLIKHLGAMVTDDGLDIVAVPTSARTGPQSKHQLTTEIKKTPHKNCRSSNATELRWPNGMCNAEHLK